jgi:hypothetical protein
MRIAAMLRAIRFMPREPAEAVEDQTYSEAAMENAVRESDRTIERLNEVAESSAQSNTQLTESIKRLELSNVEKKDVMGELIRGMKSRRN